MTSAIVSTGMPATVVANDAKVPGSARSVESTIVRLAVSAIAYRRTGSAKVARARSVRAREDKKTCWVEIRARSLPSPTPCRERSSARACSPERSKVPAEGMLRPERGSSIGPVKQMGTPPTAVESSITPWKLIWAAKRIRDPVRLSTAVATQPRPPRLNPAP